jgi:hypothetical protein
MGHFGLYQTFFCQLITFQVLSFGKYNPLIHILLSTKSEDIYTECFLKLTELSHISPKDIVVDFEKGLINAIKNVFYCNVNGCTFHFGQIIWRNMQKNGLYELYLHNTVIPLKYEHSKV